MDKMAIARGEYPAGSTDKITKRARASQVRAFRAK